MCNEYPIQASRAVQRVLRNVTGLRSQLAVLLAPLLLVSVSATAAQNTAEEQSAPMEDQTASQVTIQAGRGVVTKKQVGTTYTGIPIELVQLSRRVGYSDLDLSTTAGVDELRNRIQNTAKEACHQLDVLYPLGAPDRDSGTAQCVQEAIDGATPQARAAVAAAQGSGTAHTGEQAKSNVYIPADQSVYEPEILVNEAVVALGKLKQDPGFSKTLQKAKGVLIVPNFVKAAAIIGGQGGDGVLLVRRDEGWSNPAFFQIGGGSIGLQVGGAEGPIAVLLMNDKALKPFETESSTWNLDSTAGLTMVDYSAHAGASTANGDVILYSNTRGLFAGAAVGVRNIQPDEQLNRSYYERSQLSAQRILNGEVSNPHKSNAKLLRDVLPLRVASK